MEQTMTTPDPHTLNARLAEMCGKALTECTEVPQCPFWQETDTDEEWNPCEDPAQMDIVEEWLVAHNYGFAIGTEGDEFCAGVWPKFNQMRGVVKTDKVKRLALARAICAAIPKENP